MARPLRIEFPGAWYHVMNRARRREKLFLDDGDRTLFLKVLEASNKLFHVEVHAYVLMSNHYHLLLHTPKPNLARCMRHINGVFTQKINKKYKTDGQIFRGRYKSILVDAEEYLLEIVRYIHRNPLKKGLVTEPGDYKWSSHRVYMGKTGKPGWMVLDDVMSRFGEHESDARGALAAFVAKEVPKDLSDKLESVKWPAVLGGKVFREKVKGFIKGRKIDLSELSGHRKEIIDIENDMSKLDTLAERVKEKLSARRRNMATRKAFIYIMRRYYGLSLREIGERVGGLTYSAVSKEYKRSDDEIRGKKGCYDEAVKALKDLKSQIKI